MERKIPVIPMRRIIVLPGSRMHFDVKREKSVELVQRALSDDSLVFLVNQKDPDRESIDKENLYEYGTVAMVKQVVKVPGGVCRVMVVGQARGRLVGCEEGEHGLEGLIDVKSEAYVFSGTPMEERAMIESMYDLMDVYAAESGKVTAALLDQIKECANLSELAEQILLHVDFSNEEKLELLAIDDVEIRFIEIMTRLAEIIDLFRLKKEFQEKVKAKVDRNQKEYLLREQMKVIREELGETGTVDEAEEYRQKTELLQAPDYVKTKLRKEIERFQNTTGSSSENAVIRGYIETLLDLPWEKQSEDTTDIQNAEAVLNEDHYGLEKVKERIIDFLAVRQKKGAGAQSSILCLVGPPGTGKTSIARSIARALNKKYVRLCLGGVRDEAEIRGHRRTYIGAMPGRLINGLKQAGVSNPLILLDEIDKVSNDHKGDVSSALLEVLDPEQNSRFSDHFIEIPVDLSNVFFVATANDLQTVPRPLLDRMEIIELSSYTSNEKYHIAKDHLVSKQRERNGLKKSEWNVSDAALRSIIEGYVREAGVRQLERCIAKLCRKAAREIVEGKKKTVRVSEKNLEQYLGKPRYRKDAVNETAEIGIVRGLAWTAVGGDTLEIEVNVFCGKGELRLTGQLGDVMKESAQAGISYIRSVASKMEIAEDFFETNDIHVHIPEGAVPKDGPSAGITMATAILSAITERPVPPDIAMTGEITLRGRVLPIGGLKEKLLAAGAAGIHEVLVPQKNAKDVEELSDEVKEGLQIHFVRTMDDVLQHVWK